MDDVEFTFTKGRWKHLGEATLWNRVKSHPDVGERWYPEILRAVREEQKGEETSGKEKTGAEPSGVDVRNHPDQDSTIVAQAVEAH